MDNITMTRISDLPDLGQPQNQLSDGTYMPMNIHPNPYGLPQQVVGGGLPPPVKTQDEKIQQQNIMYMPPDFNQMPQQRLPQRDIPINMDDFTQDEQIQPNFIPRPKVTNDYIDEYQETANKKLREYENKKKNEKISDSLFDEIRIPAIISILFFIFHMPIINTMIFKRFSFLSIYNDDGNFNFNGLILKSVCFGSAFYTMNRTMDFFSEL